jgi:hypothetical protein
VNIRAIVLVVVPIESAAGTVAPGNTMPKTGIRTKPAPPPATALTEKARKATIKIKNSIINKCK